MQRKSVVAMRNTITSVKSNTVHNQVVNSDGTEASHVMFNCTFNNVNNNNANTRRSSNEDHMRIQTEESNQTTKYMLPSTINASSSSKTTSVPTNDEYQCDQSDTEEIEDVSIEEKEEDDHFSSHHDVAHYLAKSCIDHLDPTDLTADASEETFLSDCYNDESLLLESRISELNVGTGTSELEITEAHASSRISALLDRLEKSNPYVNHVSKPTEGGNESHPESTEMDDVPVVEVSKRKTLDEIFNHSSVEPTPCLQLRYSHQESNAAFQASNNNAGSQSSFDEMFSNLNQSLQRDANINSNQQCESTCADNVPGKNDFTANPLRVAEHLPILHTHNSSKKSFGCIETYSAHYSNSNSSSSRYSSDFDDDSYCNSDYARDSIKLHHMNVRQKRCSATNNNNAVHKRQDFHPNMKNNSDSNFDDFCIDDDDINATGDNKDNDDAISLTLDQLMGTDRQGDGVEVEFDGISAFTIELLPGSDSCHSSLTFIQQSGMEDDDDDNISDTTEDTELHDILYNTKMTTGVMTSSFHKDYDVHEGDDCFMNQSFSSI